MGIDYKPTTRYKIQSLDFNILKIPELDNIKPVVVSHRSRLSKKTLDEFDDDDPADLFSPNIMVSPLKKNGNDSSTSEDNSSRRKLKPSLKAKTNRSAKKIGWNDRPHSSKSQKQPK